MATFNYTDLHFFDKNGIELPVSYQTNIELEVQNEYGDNAAFYGLMDCSTHEINFIKRKSGNRFTDREKEPCILTIAGTSYSTYANVTKTKVYSSEANDNCISEVSMDNIYIEGLENIIASLQFPTVTMHSSLAFPRISVDLVETQSIYVLAEDEDGLFTKVCDVNAANDWAAHYKLLFYINNRSQEDFRFFTVDGSELKWTDKIIFDFENKDPLTAVNAFKANIGFCAKEEGVYEEQMFICLLEDFNPNDPNSGNIYPIGAINLQAEAVGEDERYRTLFQNFGVPDPIKYQEVFANTSLEEGKIDYVKLNENSKKLFLSYSEIFSYLGTYKALVNAVNVLGYTDIFFKEWYKEIGKTVPNQGYITYDMTYQSDGNANIINNIPIEERVSLKKLNWISMVYRINKELNDLPEDQWGFPQIKEVYDYNNEEIIVKLYSLKKWLEKYIIGLNCKIVDVSGEGIYFERYKIDSYGTFQQIYDWNNQKNLIPYIPTLVKNGDILDYTLIDSSADIYVSVGTNTAGTIEDYKNYTLEAFSDGYIDSDNIYHQGVSSDPDDVYAFVGRTFACLNEFETYELKASSYGEEFLFGPEYLSEDSAGIRIADNRIFFNPFDLLTKQKQSAFTLLPFIQIERANIRKIESNWNNSVKYRINPVLTDDSAESYVIKDLETGNTFETNDYLMLIPPTYEDCSTYTEITSFHGTTVKKDVYYIPTYEPDVPDGTEPTYILNKNNRTYGLRYSSNNVMDIPMFSIIGYEVDGSANFINVSNEYFLEILDGKMLFNDIENNRKLILNFNYDDNSGEQEVKVNMIYTSDEFGIVKYKDETDVSNFIPGNNYGLFILKYFNDPDSAITYTDVHKINVKNAGTFNIDVYAKDIHNNIFAKNCENDVTVHLPNFSITTYTNTDNSNNEFNVRGNSIVDINKLNDNYYDFCIYDNAYMIEKFTKSIIDDDQKLSITYPNYSYSFHKALKGDYLHFMNIADKYIIDSLDFSYKSTQYDKYIGYSFVLEREGMNNTTRVIEEYDSATLLAINNTYIEDDTTTVFSFINDLYNAQSDLEYTDVNLILYNELGNYPVLQTYGTMINENALPYRNEEMRKYKDKKYRLVIGEYSDRSYIWASLREFLEANIENTIVSEIFKAELPNIIYNIVQPESDEAETTDDTEDTQEQYNSLDVSSITFLPIVEDFINEIKASSVTLPRSEITYDELSEYLSSFHDSIINVMESYDASAFIEADTPEKVHNLVESIIPSLQYVFNDSSIYLYEDVCSLLCLRNDLILDEYVNNYMVECLDTSCNIEHILSRDDLFDGSLGNEIINAYEDTTTPVGKRLKNATIEDDIIQEIINSVTSAIKIYGNDTNEIYKAFVHNFYANYKNVTSEVNQIASSGVYATLYNSTESTIKDDVQTIIMNTVEEINDEDNAALVMDLNGFISLYTKILFATCVYIGYKLLKFVVEENNSDYVPSKYNTVYASYLRHTRDDVLVYSYQYTVKVANGLYNTVFVEDDEENVDYVCLNYALTKEFESDEDDYQIYERFIKCLVVLTADIIKNYWVIKTTDNGEILYAVAAAVEGEVVSDDSDNTDENEENEEEPPIEVHDYSDYSEESDIKPGTLYYVKPEGNVNEGLTFVEHFGEDKSLAPKNVLPNLEELVKKPYISTYIQPTWKAQITISLITEENREHLKLEKLENMDYLCIQYSSSDFTWHFRKGEMIKLVFESLTNNEYVGQSSYEVVGYDIEEQVIIVKGTINNAYIRGEKHEVWAELPREVCTEEGLELGGEDIEEREQQPLMRTYYIDKNPEMPISYRLPIKRLGGIWYYKVFYFVNGVPRAIETQKIDPQEKVNMYISYAHNAYVDYIMKAKDSFENPDGTTSLDIEYNNLNCRKMEFIDDTFVLNSKQFDINEGLSAWMNSGKDENTPAIVDEDIYSYTSENGFVPVNITSKLPNIAFEINFDDLEINEDESYVQWKVYKMSPIDNSRKYMFESYNKILYLDYAQPGIYDIEAKVFDKYGNSSTKMFKGAYKVTS